MAFLLLQDCLIDLSKIDNSISITLNENLVNKIVKNDCFNVDDSSELLQILKVSLTNIIIRQIPFM